MGSGIWSVDTYTARASQRRAQGIDDFDYSSGATGVHPTLNPNGLEMRESRDSAEHPNSNPIIVGLDVSGSMGAVVRSIHADLPKLLGLLLGQQYIPDPQIMFCAFSNSTSDRVPLQVGQFESDNRMDQNLENMILGGRLAGGADPIRESSELVLYIAARHTSTDCWEKRRRKGFLFLITDELAYDAVNCDQINRIIGDRLNRDIPLEAMVAEAQERYHLFVIIPVQAQTGKSPQVAGFWRARLGPQRVVLLQNSDDVSETLALIIGLTERTIRLRDGLGHLRHTGARKKTIDSLAKTLSMLDGDTVQGVGSSLKDLGDPTSGARRLG